MPIMLQGALLMVLAFVAAEYAAQPEVDGVPSELAADDECHVAGPGEGIHCALSALQLRGLARGNATTGPLSGHGGHESLAGQPRPVDLPVNLKTILPSPEAMPLVEAEQGKWCASGPAPRLWKPAAGPPLQVKVLSYNLFWWSLFEKRHGNNNSAGKLIAGSMRPRPYDFMGFQECEDPKRVLAGVGLLEEYFVLGGKHGICVAYAKSRWTLLAHGQQEVAEDMPMHSYGKRSAQWMRLQHLETKRKAFFVNHHGPLSINSGGLCGGHATAHNLLALMAKKAVPGDLLVLVGDFNANAASLTIQELWPHLVHAYNGDSWGGVDNIFSNVHASSVVSAETLGSGGSDHDAIAAIVGVGPHPRQQGSEAKEPGKAVKDLAAFPPGHRWEAFWCGRLEQDVEYQFPKAAETWPAMDGRAPDWCCRACQDEPRCRAWRWAKSAPAPCLLTSAGPSGRVARPPSSGVVSGLSVREAAVAAAAAAAQATARVG